jgi:hypothetical protein
MKIKIQKKSEDLVYKKITEEYVFLVNGKEVRVLSWKESGNEVDMPESDYEVNEDDKEKLTEQELEVLQDNLQDMFDVDTNYVLEETYYCDICSNEEATTEVDCKHCKEKHCLCSACLTEGHIGEGVCWDLQ